MRRMNAIIECFLAAMAVPFLMGCAALPEVYDLPEYRVVFAAPSTVNRRCTAKKWDNGDPRPPGSPVGGCYVRAPRWKFEDERGPLKNKPVILLPWDNWGARVLLHEEGHHYGTQFSTAIWWRE